MITGRIFEFRIAVVGLEGVGKSSLIKRMCSGVFGETEHTNTEQQSTAVRDNTFIYLWEFPMDYLTEEKMELTLVGFDGVIFVFDMNEFDTDFPKTKAYLRKLMESPFFNKLPYLLVGTKIDTVKNYDDVIPAKVMTSITEGLKKTEIVLISAKDQDTFPGIEDWINEGVNPEHVTGVKPSGRGDAVRLARA